MQTIVLILVLAITVEALLLQNRNTLFSFFMKSFLILFEKQQPET